MHSLIAGVDEVGRGPLAGPVVAAAVILDSARPIAGITDSKKLNEKQREELYSEIMHNSLCVSIARAEVKEIDAINIFHASLLAMKRAIESLELEPKEVLVDGKYCPDIEFPSRAIIKGDLKEVSIGAASIIAKVTRDREMVLMDNKYPGYGFAQHKGYPTKFHIAALAKLGICPIHRKSYGPVKKHLLEGV